MKLPKEALLYLYTQLDDTKGNLYRVVAKEVRDVFDRIDVADELARVLTKVSFEIKTEIRFVPGKDAPQAGHDGASEGAQNRLPKPEISTQVTLHDRGKEERRRRKRRDEA